MRARSRLYDSSKDGPPGHADVNKVGRAYVKADPERLVLGLELAHPTKTSPTTPCCRTGLRSGPRKKPSATASWSTIRQRYTVFRNCGEVG